jgi:hypothetical protein
MAIVYFSSLRRLCAELFLEAREETNRTENIKLFMCLP